MIALLNRGKVRRVAAAIFFILAGPGIFFALLVFLNPNSSPPAEKGRIDLAGWDFESKRPLLLAGDWEFYHNRLYSYTDFKKGVAQQPLLQQVPGAWNTLTVGGEALPGHGYGTYRLQVKNYPAAEETGGIYVKSASTAYLLWVDDRPAGGKGVVGTSADTTSPLLQPAGAYLPLPAGDFEIILQVANFSYPQGGLRSAILIGPESVMQRHQAVQVARQFFLTGAIVITVLLALTVFFYRPKQIANLYLALFALGLLRYYDSNSRVFFSLYNIFPFDNFSTLTRTMFVEPVWFALLLVLYVNSLYPTRAAVPLNRTFFGLAVVYSALYYLCPATFFGSILLELQIIPLIFILCSVIIAAMALKNRVRGSLFYACGFAMLLVTLVHDIFYLNRLISPDWGEISFIGLSAFFLFQALAQGLKFIDTTEEASRAELRFLQSQIRPHFINNALNAISAATLTDPARSRRLMVDLSHYLQKSFQSVDLEQKVPLEQELQLIRAYVALEQARFGDRLQVTCELGESSFLLPPLLLQPLVENAIVHGLRPRPEGGLVTIYTRKEANRMIIGVRDNGVGMTLNARGVPAAAHTTEESHGGIGLGNVRQRLQKIYGSELKITSVPGGGTDVSMNIPYERVENDD